MTDLSQHTPMMRQYTYTEKKDPQAINITKPPKNYTTILLT
jgi:DNA mismatch repair ATPase MutS